jgi:hypothetical protein
LGAAEALWPMFGQERAANSVAPRDIVGAVKVKRNFHGKTNVFNGGIFLPVEYLANAGYQGENAARVAGAIYLLVAKKEWINMPTQSMGIVESTKT